MLDGNHKGYYPYILASDGNQPFIVGITANLTRLAEQLVVAKQARTSKSLEYRLVYYEFYIEPMRALDREKRIKTWKREWQAWLVEDQNPQWVDLGINFLAR